MNAQVTHALVGDDAGPGKLTKLQVYLCCNYLYFNPQLLMYSCNYLYMQLQLPLYLAVAASIYD